MRRGGAHIRYRGRPRAGWVRGLDRLIMFQGFFFFLGVGFGLWFRVEGTFMLLLPRCWTRKGFFTKHSTHPRAHTRTQVDVVVSDKTGTLTENLMLLRMCTVGGRLYGTAEDPPPSREEPAAAGSRDSPYRGPAHAAAGDPGPDDNCSSSAPMGHDRGCVARCVSGGGSGRRERGVWGLVGFLKGRMQRGGNNAMFGLAGAFVGMEGAVGGDDDDDGGGGWGRGGGEGWLCD